MILQDQVLICTLREKAASRLEEGSNMPTAFPPGTSLSPESLAFPGAFSSFSPFLWGQLQEVTGYCCPSSDAEILM